MTGKRRGVVAGLVLVVLGSGVLPSGVRGQLPSASATTPGTADNTTSTAQGFEAIGVNPAGLGMEASGLSLAVVPIRVGTGLHPITLSDLADYSGARIPEAEKEAWLSDVVAEGGQIGTVDAQVSGLAVTVGNFGLQVSSVASADVSLPPGAVEAVLYGNAGRTGEPAALDLSDGDVRAFAASTVALAGALPTEVLGWEAAFGATVKYTMGHAVAAGRSVRGSVEDDPVSVSAEIPTILTSEAARGDVNGGQGVGLDVGFVMLMNDLHLGASVQNVFNTFEWDEAKLAFIPGTASLQEGSNTYDFDERPLDEATPEALELLDEMRLDPEVRLGAALDVTPELTVSGDLRRRFGDGRMALTPDFHVGAGVEFRHLDFLHARAGLAVVTDGFQVGAGTSLILGPVHLSGAILGQKTDRREGLGGQVTLSFWDH